MARPSFRVSTAPASPTATALPSAQGIKVRLVCSGVQCRPSCSRRLNASWNPLSAAKKPPTMARPATKLRLRNSEGVITGYLLRRSDTTNSAMATIEPAIDR